MISVTRRVTTASGRGCASNLDDGRECPRIIGHFVGWRLLLGAVGGRDLPIATRSATPKLVAREEESDQEHHKEHQLDP